MRVTLKSGPLFPYLSNCIIRDWRCTMWENIHIIKKIYSPLNSSQMKQTMYSVLDKHTDFHHFRLFPFPGLVCNAKTTKSAKSEEKSTLFQTLLHSKDTLCSRHLIQNGDMDRELSPSHQAAFQWCLG